MKAWILLLALGGLATASPAAAEGSPATPAVRDGSHDFDFDFGVWHTHIRRIKNVFSDQSEAIELDGTVTVRKVWGGRAALEEIETDGPDGHWEGMSLFLYNPAAGQWSQTFANSQVGVLQPSLIGEFKDGRGELVAQDTIGDRSILVRGVWSDIRPDSHIYTESYSGDGGTTWRPAFVAMLTRVKS